MSPIKPNYVLHSFLVLEYPCFYAKTTKNIFQYAELSLVPMMHLLICRRLLTLITKLSSVTLRVSNINIADVSTEAGLGAAIFKSLLNRGGSRFGN